MTFEEMTTIQLIRKSLRRVKQYCIFLCTLLLEWLADKVGLRIARPGYILLVMGDVGAYRFVLLENFNLPAPAYILIHVIEVEDMALGEKFLRSRFVSGLSEPNDEWFWLTDEAVEQVKQIEKLVIAEGAQK